MGRRRLVLALAAFALPVLVMAAIGLRAILGPPRVSLILADAGHPTQTATPTTSPIAEPTPVTSTQPTVAAEPSAAPSLPINGNAPRILGFLGNGVHGNALLVGYDKDTRVQTWYWDGTAWRRASTTANLRQLNSAPVFDPLLGRTIMVAGGGYGSYLETWAWNGSSWSDLHASPQPVFGTVLLGFDTATKQLIMSGDTTWNFDGTKWRQIGGPVSPGQRGDANIAYDPQHRRLVLFGGSAFRTGNIDTALNDTWTWDGTSWTLRHPATSPPGGQDSLVYDPDTQQLVLLEETMLTQNAGGAVQVSMWTWDGANWDQLHPAALPPSGLHPQLAYDSANNQLLLYQGITGRDDYASQTWIYQSGAWKQVG